MGNEFLFSSVHYFGCKMKKILSLLVVVFVLVGCGGGEQERSNAINYWQTYSASSPKGMHYWTEGEQAYTSEKIKSIGDDFKSGYGYVNSAGQLIFHNLATSQAYKMADDGGYVPEIGSSRNLFTHAGREFYMAADEIRACKINSGNSCISIKVLESSFPYVFAEANGHVLVVTNYGDAVKFDGSSWCRMKRSDLDVFVCDSTEAMVTKPRVIQFYSYIKYKGEALIGEWPTGSIYTFDGVTLAPSYQWTPPALRNREKVGYEAQSMAEYCGDLFVGYWPKGEIWRYSRTEEKWFYFKRLFSPVDGESFIPWYDRSPDELETAFYGQRVTALVPFKDSLYAITSNLRSWDSGVFADFLSSERESEYGAIWKITGVGCRTVYGSS